RASATAGRHVKRLFDLDDEPIAGSKVPCLEPTLHVADLGAEPIRRSCGFCHLAQLSQPLRELRAGGEQAGGGCSGRLLRPSAPREGGEWSERQSSRRRGS